jgi:hypothetical protein
VRLGPPAAVAALMAVGLIAAAGVLAGAVRILPWALDPSVPLRAALPFARGLGAVAVESALLVGWPLGWTVAFFRIVERGEGRVLQALGERPASTVMRLAPQGAAFALASMIVGLAWGRDAEAPGSVANELIAQERSACDAVASAVAYSVPFTTLTWLCVPGRQPRLVGAVPAAPQPAAFSASGARVSGDFRSLQLDDARVTMAPPSEPVVQVHVSHLTIRGLAPWAQASTLPAALRGIFLALSGIAGAFLGPYAVLRGVARTRIQALVIGAAGPLAALGLMRWFERLGSRPALFIALPLGSCAATLLVALMSRALARRRQDC